MSGGNLAGVAIKVLKHGRLIKNVPVSRAGTYNTRLDPGQYTLQGSAAGFITFRRTITIVSRETLRARIFMSPVMPTGAIRLVLTWNMRISDLDFHMETPNGCKVDWTNHRCTAGAASAHLDVDDTNGEGPETISIDALAPGQYKVFVHRYSAGDMLRSDATVRAIFPSGAIRVYRVGQDGVLSAPNKWDVLTIDGATGNIFGPLAQGTRWVPVTGTPAVFSDISTSQSGANVWATAGGVAYRRTGITDANKMGTGWHSVSGVTATGVAASDLGVWVWNSAGQIYARTGVSATNYGGSSWVLVPAVPGELRTASFDGANAVAVNMEGQIWWRAGITGGNPIGTRWFQVPGHMTWIGVYSNTLWGTNAGVVYRRTGMASSPPAGSGWTRVPGRGQKLGVSNGIVWMVNRNGRTFFRKGISETNRGGNAWGSLGSASRRMKDVSVGNGVVWGLDTDMSPVFRDGVAMTGH